MYVCIQINHTFNFVLVLSSKKQLLFCVCRLLCKILVPIVCNLALSLDSIHYYALVLEMVEMISARMTKTYLAKKINFRRSICLCPNKAWVKPRFGCFSFVFFFCFYIHIFRYFVFVSANIGAAYTFLYLSPHTYMYVCIRVPGTYIINQIIANKRARTTWQVY